MMKTWTGLLLLTVAATLAACGGGGTGDAGGPGGGPPTVPTASVEGRIDFRGGFPGLALDQEVNDAVDQAQDAGEVPIGGRLTIVGQVSADDDAVDGYRVRLTHRARLQLTIRYEDPTTNDIELSIFDPISLQHVEIAPAGVSPSVITTHARGAVHIVVRARAGASRYEISLIVDPPSPPVGEQEPNAKGPDAAFMGQLADGDAWEIVGTANADSDPSDAFLFVFPAAARLEATLTSPAFTEFELGLFDATTDLLDPIPIPGPQIPGGTLLLVEIHATEGSGPWRLALSVSPPAASTLSVRPLALARVASESRRLGLRAGDAPYGVPRGAFLDGQAIVRYAGGGAMTPSRVPIAVPETLDEEDGRRLTLSRVAALEARGDVLWAEPNRIVRAHLDSDDAYRKYQWHYDMIGLRDAWNLTTGSDDVIVAVIDTGQTNHPDLLARQIPGYDLISSASIAGDGNGIDSDPTDVGDGGRGGYHTWHGTHVAGTIGAVSNNDKGVAGVTWNTRLMHVRALGRGGGTTFDIANAIRYAAGLTNSSGVLPLEPAHIINMSLGGPDFSQAMQDACDAAKAAGVVLIASAGNDNTSVPSYPAAYSSVISVGAVDASRQRAPYSNYGPRIDVVAPGGNVEVDVTGDGYPDGVLSTLWDDSVTPASAIYAFYQGTSMAAPHVAGLAALMLALDPDLDPDDVQGILELTAEDLGASGRDDVYGHGLIDAYSALLQVEGEVPQGPPTLVITPEVLNFGTGQVQLSAATQNAGGEFLEIGPVTVSTEEGGDWLEAELIEVDDPRRSAVGVRVRVNRGALLPGTYLGAVEIASNGGTKTIIVAMSVATAQPPPPSLHILIVAVDAVTGEQVAQTAVNPAGVLTFAFPTLPVGDYLFFAGTDFDGDGELGDPGEYFGAWPRGNEPEPIHLIARQERDGVDFSVTFASTLTGELGGR